MTVKQIKTGDISARIGLTVTADLIVGLGFPPDATDKRAKLWNAEKYPAICNAIADNIRGKAGSTAMAESKAKGNTPPPVDDDDEL